MTSFYTYVALYARTRSVVFFIAQRFAVESFTRGAGRSKSGRRIAENVVARSERRSVSNNNSDLLGGGRRGGKENVFTVFSLLNRPIHVL